MDLVAIHRVYGGECRQLVAEKRSFVPKQSKSCSILGIFNDRRGISWVNGDGDGVAPRKACMSSSKWLTWLKSRGLQ